MDTSRNLGSDVLVVPLNNKYNRNFLPLDANGEIATPNQWFDGGSVTAVENRPNLIKEIDNAPTQVKARVLNPLDFMKGGTLL